MASKPRHDWTKEEILKIYQKTFPDLVFEAQTVHRKNFKAGEVQKSTLLSIKTGSCPEDCSYCSQSAHYHTEIDKEGLLSLEEVIKHAKKAKEIGSTRFCMGAAWRGVKDGSEFDRVLEMVRKVSALGMETCCTLGMISESQGQKLKKAGLDFYNHNLDTSPEFYGEVITTHTYDDRLKTLSNVRKAGLKVCCGGIIGLGESVYDRASLLQNLACLDPHPESVPVNMLVRIEGTPLANQKGVDLFELIRTIATARIIMPKSRVRLSAGRASLSQEAQALAFLAGANSIFSGDKLLTTPGVEADEDIRMFEKLGLK